MSIQSITLKNYRSYELASFEFGDGVTIIIGPNASGKTNLLEAVYLVCSGTSFRVSDKDLIRSDSEWARIDSLVNGEDRIMKIQKSEPRTKKSFTINDTEKARLIFDQLVPVVLFEPDDIRIIGGSPERRRDYIDTLLNSISHSYKKSLHAYKRALKQRNNLLKRRSSRQSVFAWDIVLSRHAEMVVSERVRVVDILNSRIGEVYKKLSNKDHIVELAYIPSIPVDGYATRYLHRLERSFDDDVLRGHTTAGPHRDDLEITINAKPAATHASRGEARTITLALKIIEMLLVEEFRSLKPVLLLDDVFSELDGTRRRTLTEYLKDHQSIITTTDADVVGKTFSESATIISIS